MKSMRTHRHHHDHGHHDHEFGHAPRERFRQRPDWTPGFGGEGDGPGFRGGDGWRGGHGPGHGGPGGRRGGRARRGDVRAAVLALLAERPMHGYEMIQELAARTDGVWRPSPGALYPALQLLQDEGLVSATEVDGKRLLTLTEAGREAAAAGGSDAPWEQMTAGVPPVHHQLRSGVEAIATATRQVAQVGTAEQQAAAAKILTDARKALYRLLADAE